MKSSQKEYYPAKLLLFGEYSVLNGSQALAIPLLKYQGRWIQQDHTDHSYRSSFEKYIDWLFNELLIDKNIASEMRSDLDEGWYFSSSIPYGYGIGSSGALVAGVYDKYFKKQADIAVCQAIMAHMENYFHGASSGLDPLISYSHASVLKDHLGRYHCISNKGWPEGFQIYLMDSGIHRETAPLVNIYKNKLQDPFFLQKLERQYMPMVEHAIHFYLYGENKMLEECIQVISNFQFEYFKEMIPEIISRKWKELISIPGVFVKLCGAGGGGYFMVISTRQTPFNTSELIQVTS